MMSVRELASYAPPVCQDCIDRMESAPEGAWTICGDHTLVVVQRVRSDSSPWLTERVLLSRTIPPDVASAIRDGAKVVSGCWDRIKA